MVKKLMMERLQVVFHSNQIDVISNAGEGWWKIQEPDEN